MRKLSILILSGIILFWGCKKNTTLETNDNSELYLKAEQLGEIHNEILGQIMDNPDIKSQSLEKQFGFIAGLLLKANYISTDITKLGYEKPFTISDVKNNLWTNFKTEKNIVIKSIYDDIQTSFKKSNSLEDVNSLYKNLKNRILSLDEQFSSEKICLLGAISIMKSSAHFWNSRVKVSVTGNVEVALGILLDPVVMSDLNGFVSAYNQVMNSTDATCLADPVCRHNREGSAIAWGVDWAIAASANFPN
jgi:hypothetical protein